MGLNFTGTTTAFPGTAASMVTAAEFPSVTVAFVTLQANPPEASHSNLGALPGNISKETRASDRGVVLITLHPIKCRPFAHVPEVSTLAERTSTSLVVFTLKSRGEVVVLVIQLEPALTNMGVPTARSKVALTSIWVRSGEDALAGAPEVGPIPITAVMIATRPNARESFDKLQRI